MSDSYQKPWSDNPNAPIMPYDLYFYEKTLFAGNLVSAIPYGIVIVLFFKSLAALFDPVHRRGGPVKWGLVTYTVVMFLLVTIGTALQLDTHSISYINNRGFPGVEGVLSPGPLGYQQFINPEAIAIIQNVVSNLNNWLADGFLLYRCYVVYSMNLWVIAFPCLMFLGSLAMGIAFVYQGAQVDGASWSALPYFSISLSLNILLTLMIVARLILHARDTRTALGIPGMGGLYKTIVIMLIESCALFAVNSLLVIGPLGAENSISNLFMATLAQIQVIAPLLVILRVANKSALTSDTLASVRVGGFKARTRGELTGDGAHPGGDRVSPVDGHGMNSVGLAVGILTTDVDPHRNRTQGSPSPNSLRG